MSAYLGLSVDVNRAALYYLHLGIHFGFLFCKVPPLRTDFVFLAIGQLESEHFAPESRRSVRTFFSVSRTTPHLLRRLTWG